jgi:hypothetical protein
MAHQGVLALAGGQFGQIVRQGPLEKGLGGRTADADLAHMGDVKEAGGLPHSEVLVGNARVLDGHFPAAEFDEFTP